MSLQASPTGTPEAPTSPEPVVETANVPEPVTIELETPSSPSGNEKEIATESVPSKPVQRNENAELVKNATLEAQLHQIRKEKEQMQKELEDARRAKSTLEEIDSTYASDKEAYEKMRAARIKQGKSDPGTYEEVYAQLNNQPTPGGNTVAQLNPEEIASRAAIIAQQSIDIQTAGKNFLAKHPELDYTNVAPDSPEYSQKSEKLSSIVKIAATLKSIDPNLSFEASMEKALRTDDDFVSSEIRSAKEDGELTGFNNALGKGTGSAPASSSAAAQAPVNAVKVQLSKEQQKTYDRLVASGKIDIAKGFVRNIYLSKK